MYKAQELRDFIFLTITLAAFSFKVQAYFKNYI